MSDVILFEDFKHFLFEQSHFFSGQDLEWFMRDVEIGLKLEGDRVSICQIAAMIEYDSECFPQWVIKTFFFRTLASPASP